MHTKKKNCQFKKIIAKQRVLWNLVQAFKFCVELVYVHVFSLFSIERIFVKNLFQYSDPHIAKFVSREIEVFSSSLWQILIPHITLVFCKPLFHLSIRLTNILDVTFLACDQINDIWWCAVNFLNNLMMVIRSCCFHMITCCYVWAVDTYQEFFFLVWKLKKVFLLWPEFVSDFSVFCMLLKGEEEIPPLGEGLAPLFCSVSL